MTESVFSSMSSLRRASLSSVGSMVAFLFAACSNPSSPAQSSGATEIPRFPADAFPQGSSSGEPGPQVETSSTGQDRPTSSGLESSGVSTGSQSSSLSTLSSTPSSAGGSDSGPDPAQEHPAPGEASYVDAAYVKIVRLDDGEIMQSFKWQSPQEEHQYVRLGNRRVTNYMGGDSGNMVRNSYIIFDVSQVKDAKRAQIEVFMFARSNATNGFGGFDSPDPEERVEIHAVERYTPQQILDAPFNDLQDHSFDLGLFEDLQDGQLYGSGVFRPEVFNVEHLVPTPTATGEHRNCADDRRRACGRWYTFELNQAAVQAINQSSKYWATGWTLATITHDKSPASKNPLESSVIDEWLFVGGFFDLNPTKDSYPDYLGPTPRLIIDPPQP